MKRHLLLLVLVGLTSCSKETPGQTESSSTDPVLKLAIEPPKSGQTAEPSESISPKPITYTSPARNTNLIEIEITDPANAPKRLVKLLEQMKKPEFKPTEDDLKYLRTFYPKPKEKS